MEDYKRGFDMLYIIDRRFSFNDNFCCGIPGIATKIQRYQPPCISFSKKCGQVIYTSLCTGCFESLVMCNDQGNQVARIRTTCKREFRSVSPAFCDGFIKRCQYITCR